ncbi:hypothetical protein HNP87_001291 [Methanococcus maripaludis]|uniref:Uncharacterized protein n=1 Tax=Methanococcus maripaludis TaxID=39152 RepID=A0A7J9NKE5_METMI|nr:hypothetical protein [Methanococcus maripaludis]MBA2840759.1 hypothetical protein [Methanococcus maripaludis]
MKKINLMVITISLWAILTALLSPSIDLYITLLLIGTLIFFEIGDFFISKNNKDSLKIIVYILAGIFATVVLNKVYTIIK